MKRVLSVTLPALLFLAGCSASPDYQDDWGGDDIASGKADGLADLAQSIEFGETVTGEVDSQSMVLYKIALQHGDQLTLTKNVTDGDLSPHFTLFFGVSSSVSSTTFDVTASQLVKTYTVDDTGTHIVAVRAFQNQGSGTYDFRVECNAGPCNGDFTAVLLKDFEADECLEKAQECSFEDMKVFNGAVGPVRAQSIFEKCVNKLSTDDGLPCASACVSDPPAFSSGPDDVCDDIIGSLPFFADQSDLCIQELNFCMTECQSLSDGGFAFESNHEIFQESFSVCWTFGLNGTCPGYAHELETCGGTLETDSEEACEELCAASNGAWADDLSSACPGDVC